MANILIVALFVVLTSIQSFARDLRAEYESAQLKVGAKTIKAYVADSESGRQQGLMFVEKLPSDTGMLFVFEHEQPLSFWMKNTLIPLSIAFIDKTGKIVDVQEMKPGPSSGGFDYSVPTYHSAKPAMFALEMEAGWFQRHKVTVGDRMKLLNKPNSKLLKQNLSN